VFKYNRCRRSHCLVQWEILHDRWSSYVEPLISTLVETAIAIADKQTDHEQLAHMVAIKEQLMPPTRTMDLIQAKHLSELMFNVLSQRTESGVDNFLLLIRIEVWMSDACKRSEDRITGYSWIDPLIVDKF
jgi:hypothetical protein